MAVVKVSPSKAEHKSEFSVKSEILPENVNALVAYQNDPKKRLPLHWAIREGWKPLPHQPADHSSSHELLSYERLRKVRARWQEKAYTLLQYTDLSIPDEEGFTPLATIARYGADDLELLKTILPLLSPEILNAAKSGMPALHHAIYKSNADYVEALIKAKVDINLKAPSSGWTPLMLAMTLKSAQDTENDPAQRIRRALVKHKQITLNAQNNEGQTALHIALMEGNTEAACYLLKYKADPYITDNNNQTALHYLAIHYAQKPDEAEKILKSMQGKLKYIHKYINGQDKDGKTPLALALSRDCNDRIYDILTALGASTGIADNTDRIPLLHLLDGHQTLKRRIAKQESTINFKAPESKATPLHLAAINPHNKTIDALIEANPNLLHETMKGGRTPLLCALEAGIIAHAERIIRKDTTTLDHVMNNGDTPLHLAGAIEGGFAAIQKAVGVMPLAPYFTKKDAQGQTPVHKAVAAGCPINVNFAITHLHINEVMSVDIAHKMLDNQGQTPLHTAAQSHTANRLEMLEYLLKKRQFPIFPDKQLKTPLHHAILSGCEDSATYLAGHMENSLDATDENGCTALHYACQKRYYSTIAPLLNHLDVSATKADNEGKTPLYYLYSQKLDLKASDYKEQLALREKATLALIQRGADTAILAATAQSLIRKGWTNEFKSLMELLKPEQRKAVLEHKDSKGETLIYTACRVGKVSITRLLVEDYKARLYIENKETKLSPLQCALQIGKTDILDILHNKESITLHDVVDANAVAAIPYLTSKGNIDLEEKDQGKNTPLESAMAGKHWEIAAKLLDLGAKITDQANLAHTHAKGTPSSFEKAWKAAKRTDAFLAYIAQPHENQPENANYFMLTQGRETPEKSPDATSPRKKALIMPIDINPPRLKIGFNALTGENFKLAHQALLGLAGSSMLRTFYPPLSQNIKSCLEIVALDENSPSSPATQRISVYQPMPSSPGK